MSSPIIIRFDERKNWRDKPDWAISNYLWFLAQEKLFKTESKLLKERVLKETKRRVSLGNNTIIEAFELYEKRCRNYQNLLS